MGDMTGDEPAWQRERQVWRPRNKKLPGAQETTLFHFTGTYKAKVGILMRDEVKVVSKVRPSRVVFRM